MPLSTFTLPNILRHGFFVNFVFPYPQAGAEIIFRNSLQLSSQSTDNRRPPSSEHHSWFIILGKKWRYNTLSSKDTTHFANITCRYRYHKNYWHHSGFSTVTMFIYIFIIAQPQVCLIYKECIFVLHSIAHRYTLLRPYFAMRYLATMVGVYETLENSKLFTLNNTKIFWNPSYAHTQIFFYHKA
jgi:hypothetical protein